MSMEERDREERDKQNDETQDWPELTEWPQLMPNQVSDDFVERTFQRVVQDQRRIAQEADQVDDVQFPPGFLDTYQVPEPSGKFSSRLMARLEKGEPLSTWQRQLATYTTPEPSQDFVDRTLAALERFGDTPRPRALRATNLRFKRPALYAAAAAAVLVTALLWPRTEPLPSITASAYSASPFATAMAAQIQAGDVGALDLGAPDPLLLMATGALAEEQE